MSVQSLVKGLTAAIRLPWRSFVKNVVSASGDVRSLHRSQGNVESRDLLSASLSPAGSENELLERRRGAAKDLLHPP
jgi:hypothetical protein